MKCTFDSGETFNTFQTFFRRYTDNRMVWASGTTSKNLFDTCGGMSNIQQEFIIELVDKKIINIQQNDNYEKMKFERPMYDDTRKITKVELTTDF